MLPRFVRINAKQSAVFGRSLETAARLSLSKPLFVYTPSQRLYYITPRAVRTTDVPRGETMEPYTATHGVFQVGPHAGLRADSVPTEGALFPREAGH